MLDLCSVLTLLLPLFFFLILNNCSWFICSHDFGGNKKARGGHLSLEDLELVYRNACFLFKVADMECVCHSHPGVCVCQCLDLLPPCSTLFTVERVVFVFQFS